MWSGTASSPRHHALLVRAAHGNAVALGGCDPGTPSARATWKGDGIATHQYAGAQLGSKTGSPPPSCAFCITG